MWRSLYTWLRFKRLNFRFVLRNRQKFLSKRTREGKIRKYGGISIGKTQRRKVNFELIQHSKLRPYFAILRSRNRSGFFIKNAQCLKGESKNELKCKTLRLLTTRQREKGEGTNDKYDLVHHGWDLELMVQTDSRQRLVEGLILVEGSASLC